MSRRPPPVAVVDLGVCGRNQCGAAGRVGVGVPGAKFDSADSEFRIFLRSQEVCPRKSEATPSSLASEIQFYFAPMETCNRASSTLCRLFLQAMPKFFASSPGLLKTRQMDEHVHPPLMQAATVGTESPYLPQDALIQILALLETPDLVRAGSVCSSWRAAYTSLCITGDCRVQQTPCLLYTSESTDAREAGLYSLAEKKAYTLTLPDPPIHSRYIIGSSFGWIITADERSELHLLNPITSEQIALPSVTTIEQVEPVFDDKGTVCNYKYLWYTGEDVISDTPSVFPLSELRESLFYKAFLSSDPSMGSYFVVLIHNPQSQLSFARAGDDEWTWLPPHTYYVDCLFKDGLLYASTLSGEIHTFDLCAPLVEANVVLGEMKDYLFEKIYTVQAPSGELLQIWRSLFPPLGDEENENDSDFESELDDDSHLCNTFTINVHKVDLTSKKLVEISSLGQKCRMSCLLGITNPFSSVLKNTHS